MADGKVRHDARLVASLRAGIANGPLRKRGKAFWTADDFDPYSQSAKHGQSGIPFDRKTMTSFRSRLFGYC